MKLTTYGGRNTYAKHSAHKPLVVSLQKNLTIYISPKKLALPMWIQTFSATRILKISLGLLLFNTLRSRLFNFHQRPDNLT